MERWDDLSAERIRESVRTAWAGREIEWLMSVDSTNRYARQRSREGAAHGTLVIAERQTGGRGRRGRSWISPAGEGVFMTLILRIEREQLAGAAQLSLRTALAVSRAISRASGLDARIKWPNDIVCQGRKVCGMLLEMEMTPDGGCAIAAGVGVNVHQRALPEEIAATASSLDLLAGGAVSREKVVCAFLEEMEAVLAMDGDAAMAAYRERSATLGCRVQVISPSETFTGTAQEVTSGGSLLVLQDGGPVREVLAADVSVRGLMGYV